MMSTLPNFLVQILLWGHISDIFFSFRVIKVSSYISSENFMVFGLTFGHMIHLS